MALRDILTIGNHTLRKRSREVTVFDDKLATLLDDISETLKKANGVGLAAPQVGILRRIFLVDTGEKVIEFINPEIMEFSGTQTGAEGCLSVPGRSAVVTRPLNVTVKAFDRFGKEFTVSLTDLACRAVFHENDHLDGVLYVDKMDRELTEEDLEDVE